MKVSIALCVFNGEDFLEEQLASIAAQTRLPDEVVVGDDGSTDRTMEILESWKNSVPFPVRITRNPVNLRHTKNFEETVKRGVHEIVFFCDQDDVWMPEKIERILRLFEGSPETLLVCHETQVVDSEGNETGLTERTLRGRGNKTCSLRFLTPVNESAPIVSGCCMAVRRSFLQETLPFFCAHDVCIYAQARARSGIRTLLDPPLMKYRFHGKNVSLCGSLKAQDQRDTELEQSLYRLDVSRFWGHFAEIEEFRRRVEQMPESAGRTETLRFLDFTVSHLTNRSRVQRNFWLFWPLWLFEIAALRYFRREQPFRSIFYDWKCGILAPFRRFLHSGEDQFSGEKE